jgi:hypothetical protein
MLVDDYADLLRILMGNEHRHTGRIRPRRAPAQHSSRRCIPFNASSQRVLPHVTNASEPASRWPIGILSAPD